MSCQRITWDKCFFIPGEGVYCKVETESSQKYQKVGVLTNTRIGPLPLFGVRTQPSSAEWYYYTHSAQDPPQTLPIQFKNRNCQTSTRGCNEVRDGDEVAVQGYPGEVFNVSLFQF